jgi:hypothetical protein
MQQFIENFKKELPEFTLEIIDDVSQEVISSWKNKEEFLMSIFEKTEKNSKLVIAIELNEKTKVLYKTDNYDEDKILVFAKHTTMYINKKSPLDKIKKIIINSSTDVENNCNICMNENDELHICPICYFKTCCICEINQYICSIRDNKLEKLRYECPQCKYMVGDLFPFAFNNASEIKEKESIFSKMVNKKIELSGNASNKVTTCFILLQMLNDYADKEYIGHDDTNRLAKEIISLSCKVDQTL